MIVGIDPGTKLGWATFSEEGIRSGVADCSVGRHESAGLRWVKLQRELDRLIHEGVELVVYEDVRRHAATYAAQIYGGIVSHIQRRCVELGVEYLGAPVGKVKKHATGKGNAKKPEMIAAAQKHVGLAITDDNEADAICILAWAIDYVSGELAE